MCVSVSVLPPYHFLKVICSPRSTPLSLPILFLDAFVEEENIFFLYPP